MSELTECGAQVPLFFAGRAVFITGATGFMGKVLVERLLSTCPGIGSLFLLMREKKDLNPEKRLAQLKHSQVFDILRQQSPQQLDKLVIVPGDVTQHELGMTADSIQLLKQVSVVFHAAATVKFNEGLKKAVDQNLRSTMRMLDMCDRLPNILALIHVSTAYSNTEHSFVEERVYPPPVDLQELMTFVDTTPEHVLDDMTSHYISPKPNTYTFTKAMAEHALQQRRTNRFSVAIFRPTIVVSTLRHPFPGWVDNFNGPSGVVAGASSGLLRVSPTRGAARCDLLPADIAIDTLICVAWETAIDRCTLRVYNCTTGEKPLTWKHFEVILNRAIVKHPLSNAMWYPHVSAIGNRFAYKTMEFILQTIPLHLIEYTKRMLGRKSKHSLIKTGKMFQSMNEMLSFFSVNEWRFDNGNIQRLRNRLTSEDRSIYNLDPRSIDWEEHVSDFVKGTRKFLMREKDEDIPQARERMKKLRILHICSKLLLTIIFLRYIIRNQYIRDFVHKIWALFLLFLNPLTNSVDVL